MQEVYKILPKNVMQEVKKQGDEGLEEIRMRTGKRLILSYKDKESMTDYMVTGEDIERCLELVCGYSMYAYENQLREGYITIKGGHRVGIAGKAVVENGSVKTVKNISSLNIRVSHEIIGISDKLMSHIKGSFVIISPPGYGKTTLMRDIIRNLSQMEGQRVGVIDERSEIAACFNGVAQNDLGPRSDILDCCPKEEGIMMLVRSMAPTYVAVDELGNVNDINAAKKAVNLGINIAATVHGTCIEEVINKKNMDFFDTYLEIKKGRKYLVYNRNKEMVASVML